MNNHKETITKFQHGAVSYQGGIEQVRKDFSENVNHFKQLLCQRCQHVDFLQIAFDDWQSKYSAPFDEASASSTCALCTILRQRIDHFVLAPLKSSSSSPEVSAARERMIFTFAVTRRGGTVQLSNAPWSAGLPIWPSTPELLDHAAISVGLEKCTAYHKSCRVEKKHGVEHLRLIDCKRRQVVPAPPTCNYVALSYVWGRSSNPPLQQNGRLPNKVVAVIEDAITVTKLLGFSFLWVDQYCIDQENADSEIFKHQINHMHQIYGGAQLTIVACAGEDAAYGLPGVNGRTRSVIVPNSPTCMLVPYPKLLSYHLASSKWSTRGWTYQEAVFSNRRLMFTDQQAFLVCKEKQVTECLISEERPAILFRFDYQIPYRGECTEDNLNKAIAQYTSRELTFDCDVLSAFQGVLRSFQDIGIYSHWGITERPTYSYGTPVPHFVEASQSFTFGLCWDSDFSKKKGRRPGFPSWSWAAWRHTVSRFAITPNQKKETSNVLVDVELAIGDLVSWAQTRKLIARGMASTDMSPFIHITAKCLDISMEWYRHWVAIVYETDGKTICKGLFDIEFRYLDHFGEDGEKSVRKLVGILVSGMNCNLKDQVFVLVVEKRGEWWERVGACHIEKTLLENPRIPWSRRTLRLG